MMSVNMFTLFILFAGRGKIAGDRGDAAARDSDNSTAAFAFFLWISYAVFSALLSKYRKEVVKGPMSRKDQAAASDQVPADSEISVLT